MGANSRKSTNVYLTRPARRQVPKGSGPIRHEFSHHSSDYNIWYHKKMGDKWDEEERYIFDVQVDFRVKSATRCCVASDAGYTRADKSNKDTYICIYFAKGNCVNGAECAYYHRIPTEEDERRADVTHDIFGRSRHRNYRDDMGGVGSFTQENRTIQVNGLKRSSNLEETITMHFAEWGELEAVKVDFDKSLALVKYKLRAAAEFAKEAMTDQSLDGDELLTVRWAQEDPNPASREEEEAKAVARVMEAVAKRRAEEPQYTYEPSQSDVDPSAPEQDHFPSQYYPETYPSTDSQYSETQEYGHVIRGWLRSVGREEYTDAFLSAGYFDLETLGQLDDVGLDLIGVSNLHHRQDLLHLAQRAAHFLKAEENYSFTNQQYLGLDPNQ